MTNTLMPCKLETMIYATGDGTYSVFTLNPNLQKQLADLAEQQPEVCCRKENGEAGGVIYVLDKPKLSIWLQAPYSEERRWIASENAMQTGFKSRTK